MLIVYDNNKPGNIKYKTANSSNSPLKIKGFGVTALASGLTGSVIYSESNGAMQPGQWGAVSTQCAISVTLNTPEL